MKKYLIRPSNGLSIDDNLNIYNKEGDLVEVKKDKFSRITIELYGKKVRKSLHWFLHIAKRGISLPPEVMHEIEKIKIIKVAKWYSEFFTVSSPIIYLEKYAIVPGENNIAISVDGAVINYLTGKILRISGKSKYRSIEVDGKIKKLHRLVALAWIPNDNPVKNNIVNHKDGDPTNFHKDNLEWVSFSGNISHAYETGLRTDNIYVKVKHKNSKEEISFYSMRKMCEYIGIKGLLKSDIINMRLGSTKNGYEIRLSDDDRPWYFKTGKEIEIPRFASDQYVLDTGKEVKTFFNRVQLRLYLGLKPGTKEHVLQKYLKDKKYDLKVTPLLRTGPYEVLNTETNTITEYPSILEASKSLNLQEDALWRTLKRGEETIYKTYAFRYKTKRPWTKELKFPKVANTPSEIQVTNDLTNENYTTASLRAAERLSGISSKTIQKLIETKRSLNNFSFSYK